MIEDDTLVNKNTELVKSDIMNPGIVKVFKILSNDKEDGNSLANDLEDSDLFADSNQKEEHSLGYGWIKVTIILILVYEDYSYIDFANDNAVINCNKPNLVMLAINFSAT